MFLLYLWIIMCILFLVSLIGVLIPFVPDTSPLWVAFFLFHFFGPGSLPVIFWVSMVVITALILVADYFPSAYFVNKYGGSKLAVIGAGVGLIVGPIILGPAGVLVGPFAVVVVISLLEKKKAFMALKIGTVTMVAIFSSAAVKFVLQLVMIIWFFIIAV